MLVRPVAFAQCFKCLGSLRHNQGNQCAIFAGFFPPAMFYGILVDIFAHELKVAGKRIVKRNPTHLCSEFAALSPFMHNYGHSTISGDTIQMPPVV